MVPFLVNKCCPFWCTDTVNISSQHALLAQVVGHAPRYPLVPRSEAVPYGTAIVKCKVHKNFTVYTSTDLTGTKIAVKWKLRWSSTFEHCTMVQFVPKLYRTMT